MKNHEDHKWKPFRKVDIAVIDPNNEVPKWDLITSSSRYVPDTVNPFDITKNPGKRGAIVSPEARAKKRTNIDDWQIVEFVWAFLEGTKTVPEYKNLTWEQEETNNVEELEAEVDDEEAVTENDDDSEEEEVVLNED